MMSADWGLGTTFAVTGNVALLEPAGTVTLAGAVAATGLSLSRATVKPPAGAAELSTTVPVTGVPGSTSVGLARTAVSVGVVVGVGVGVGVGVSVGVGVVLTLQPESVAVVAVADPSLTATRQSAGLAKPSRWSLNAPFPSLVVIATPSTVIDRFAVAVPSTRNCAPLSSARETRTVANADGAATSRMRRLSVRARAYMLGMLRPALIWRNRTMVVGPTRARRRGASTAARRACPRPSRARG